MSVVVKIWRDLRVVVPHHWFWKMQLANKTDLIVQSAQRYWYCWLNPLDQKHKWKSFNRTVHVVSSFEDTYFITVCTLERCPTGHCIMSLSTLNLSALSCELWKNLWLGHYFMCPCQGFAVAARSQGKHKQRIWLKISSIGLKIMDERSGVSHLMSQFSLSLLVVLYCSSSTFPRLDGYLETWSKHNEHHEQWAENLSNIDQKPVLLSSFWAKVSVLSLCRPPQICFK